MSTNVAEVTRPVAEMRAGVNPLYAEIGRVIVGQKMLLDRLLVGLLAGGHILLEGVPGLAKTLAVRTLAQALRLSFHRIQFTPDLLPADVVGTQIYNPRTGEFTVKQGPVFANVVLADEINRTTPKTQSALLEAMAEGHVTVEGMTHLLPAPFIVVATQNPIEHHGTYPLPESQLDRFMLRLRIGYPGVEDERQILRDRERKEPLDEVSRGQERRHRPRDARDHRVYGGFPPDQRERDLEGAERELQAALGIIATVTPQDSPAALSTLCWIRLAQGRVAEPHQQILLARGRPGDRGGRHLPAVTGSAAGRSWPAPPAAGPARGAWRTARTA